MKKITLLLLSAFALCFYACKKDNSLETKNIEKESEKNLILKRADVLENPDSTGLHNDFTDPTKPQFGGSVDNPQP